MLGKQIKRDPWQEREATTFDDLCLDPCSKYRYLEKMAHGKAEPIQVLLKKRYLTAREVAPQKHHRYLDLVLKQLDNGGLAGR